MAKTTNLILNFGKPVRNDYKQEEPPMLSPGHPAHNGGECCRVTAQRWKESDILPPTEINANLDRDRQTASPEESDILLPII